MKYSKGNSILKSFPLCNCNNNTAQQHTYGCKPSTFTFDLFCLVRILNARFFVVRSIFTYWYFSFYLRKKQNTYSSIISYTVCSTVQNMLLQHTEELHWLLLLLQIMMQNWKKLWCFCIYCRLQIWNYSRRMVTLLDNFVPRTTWLTAKCFWLWGRQKSK